MPVFEALKVKDLLEALDAKWSVALTAALSTGVLLYMHRTGNAYFTKAPDWLPLVLLILFVFSCTMSMIWLIRALWILFQRARNRHVVKLHQEATLYLLNSLNRSEHEVLSYCVMTGGQSFTATIAEERLATLIQKGIVERASGQFSILDWPHMIPSFVWERLLEREDEFQSANPSARPPYSRRRI